MEIRSIHAGAAGRIEVKDAGSFRIHTLGATTGTYAGFELGGADFIKVTTISHWGTDCLCTIGRYNEQPMVTLWNTLVRFKDVTYEGEKPLLRILQEIEQNGKLNDFLAWSGANNTNPAYESIAANVLPAWGALLLMIAIFTVVSVIALTFIDNDRR